MLLVVCMKRNSNLNQDEIDLYAQVLENISASALLAIELTSSMYLEQNPKLFRPVRNVIGRNLKNFEIVSKYSGPTVADYLDQFSKMALTLIAKKRIIPHFNNGTNESAPVFYLYLVDEIIGQIQNSPQPFTFSYDETTELVNFATEAAEDRSRKWEMRYSGYLMRKAEDSRRYS